MTHDIQDLLNLIKELEERIISLELQFSSTTQGFGRDENAWYWDH